MHNKFCTFQGHFKIDENVGTITTNGSIDREKTAYHNLTVAAKDGGIPQNSANVEVVISIIDVNDNVPSFTRRNYTVEIAENVTIGSIIARVRNFVLVLFKGFSLFMKVGS